MGIIMGVIHGDTRSVAYSSNGSGRVDPYDSCFVLRVYIRPENPIYTL